MGFYCQRQKAEERLLRVGWVKGVSVSQGQSFRLGRREHARELDDGEGGDGYMMRGTQLTPLMCPFKISYTPSAMLCVHNRKKATHGRVKTKKRCSASPLGNLATHGSTGGTHVQVPDTSCPGMHDSKDADPANPADGAVIEQLVS